VTYEHDNDHINDLMSVDACGPDTSDAAGVCMGCGMRKKKLAPKLLQDLLPDGPAPLPPLREPPPHQRNQSSSVLADLSRFSQIYVWCSVRWYAQLAMPLVYRGCILDSRNTFLMHIRMVCQTMSSPRTSTLWLPLRHQCG
jgi:hypothetical protein